MGQPGTKPPSFGAGTAGAPQAGFAEAPLHFAPDSPAALSPVPRAIAARARTGGTGKASFAAFLRQTADVDPDLLLRAQIAAQRLDATPGDVLLAEGTLSPAALAGYHARWLGAARFDPGQHRVDDDALAQGAVTPQTCLKHAVVPVRDAAGRDGLLVARPDRLDRVRPDLPAAWQALPLVIGTEAEVQGAIADSQRAVLTPAASARVPLHESCRAWGQGRRRRQAVIYSLLAGLLALAILAPLPVFTALVGWACLTLIITAIQRAAAITAFLTAPAPAPGPRAETPQTSASLPAAPGILARPDAALPRISVLVPLFRERNIATHLLARLQRLDYPAALLDVVLVLEETDTTTREVLEHVPLPPWLRCIIVPDGQPRTKPRAMNYALDFCRGDIIGIWDAEDAPAPDQLLRVARHFATAPADVACLQGVLDYYNPRQNWMARCFTVEYASWFRVMMPGMARLGFAIPLGGTTLFMRRDALERLGGWDAHNVTEDADLGFRLARHGYRTEMLDTTTGEEANCHLWPWIRQRSRWLKGYMVTWLVHMRSPARLRRQLGTWRFIGMQTHFIAALSQFLLAPLLWSLWLIPLGFGHPVQALVPGGLLLAVGLCFILAELLIITLGLIATRGPAHRHLRPWVPSLHFYYPLGCIAAYKALWELISDPFYWDKTAHGLSLPHCDAPPTAAPDGAPAASDRPAHAPSAPRPPFRRPSVRHLTQDTP